MDDEPRSLKAVFADAESKRLALESAPFKPNSTEYLDTVSSAVRLYQKCLGLIAALSIFSPNESLEDLSTNDLPFLLTNFFLAELIQKLPSSSSAERKRILSAARDAYERYLHTLDSYGLLSSRYRKLLEQYTDSPTTFSMISSSDPAARRDTKIAIFKAEKELRSKLEFLRSQPDYATEDGDGDEDAVRQVHLAHLDYSTHMAFQALEGLNGEWEILALAPPEQPSRGPNPQEAEDARRRQHPTAGGLGDNSTDYSDRLDQPLRGARGLPGGPLLSTQGKPLQPFTLLNNRQELANGVFRPGHNLPTMTIDEYLEEEKRRGGIIEGGGEASWHRPEPDEDDIEKADEETVKARQWDEFVEANPRGSGNTLNRG